MSEIRVRQNIAMVVLVALLALFGIVIGVLTSNPDYQSGFLFMAISSFFIALLMMRKTNIATAMMVGYFLRVLICVIYTLQGDGDADYYGVYAVSFSQMPLDQVFKHIPTSAYLYSWVISFIFRWFGECYMPVRVVNCFFSTVCISVVADIIKEIYGSKTLVQKSAWWMALFPNLIRFSSYFANREVMILLFMCLYMREAVRFYFKGRARNLFLSVVYLIPTMALHTSMIVMMALTVLIIITRPKTPGRSGADLLMKLLLVAVTILVFIYLFRSGVGAEKFQLSGGSETSLESISQLGNMSAEGRAAYLKGVSFSNPILILLFLPIRALYFLFTPFVWMIRTLIDIVGLFDAALYLLISIPICRKCVRFLKNRQEIKKNKIEFLLIITLILIVAMFAMVTSNYGTAIRHRCKLFPIFLMIAIDDLELPLRLSKN